MEEGKMDTGLIKADVFQRALAEAKTVPEVKDLADKADLFRRWLKKQKAGMEAQNAGAIMHLQAVRKLGEMIALEEREQGKRTDLTSGHNVTKLAELTKELKESLRQLYRWQKLAKIPEEIFQEFIAEYQQQKEITTNALWHFYSSRVIQPLKVSPPLPEGKFSVILADPPWRYDFDVESRATEKHYPTLVQEQISHYTDIKGRPIQDVFANDAILFLWATAPKLNEAMQVISDWGFIYKTNMVWVKDKIGLGWYCRNQHELLLIAEKGTMPLPEQAARPASVLTYPRTTHSRKPPEIYSLIETLYPADRYLECFGLDNNRPKWTVFGNEMYQP
jgi:N6-adenosine-specific RNA methylase IME4